MLNNIFILAPEIKIRYLFILLCCLAVAAPSEFETISIDDGLSQSSVFCIYQDQTGFLWFGTEEGLNRYDGINFNVIHPGYNDKDDMTTYPIYFVEEDKDQNLWLAVYGYGLVRYDLSQNNFTHYYHDQTDTCSISSDFVWSILCDSDGNLWIATDGSGLNRYDKSRDCFYHYDISTQTPFQLSDDYIYALEEAPNGDLYIGTAGGVDILNPGKGIIDRYNTRSPGYKLTDDFVYALEMDGDNLWVGTNGDGLNHLNLETGKITHYRFLKNDSTSISSDNITAIYLDKGGTLWIGTEDGLNRYIPETGNFNRYNFNPYCAYSLADNNILSILEDNSGQLWIGTMTGGISKLNRRAKPFRQLSNSQSSPHQLTSNHVFNFMENPDGTIWIGTVKGLNLVDLQAGTARHFFHDPDDSGSISDDGIWCLWRSASGELWIGTDYGLNIYDEPNNNFKAYYPDSDYEYIGGRNAINVIYRDQALVNWIGTGEGLWQFDVEKGAFNRFKSSQNVTDIFDSTVVTCLLEDNQGFLWVGTENDGLLILDQSRNTYQHFISNSSDTSGFNSRDVTAIHEDRDGIIWVGTFGGGLKRYNRSDNTFSCWTIDDGLPNNVVYGILEDEFGHLWFSTNRGLVKFEKHQNIFHNYDVRDGLQSNEFNAGAAYRDSTGLMFFGGIKGLNYFYPDSIRHNSQIPPIVLTDFRLFNKTVPIAPDSPLKSSINTTDQLELSYDDYVFSFSFVALNYQLSSKNQYAYRLEGFEDNWNWVGNQTRAVYTSIPPGSYLFRVIGSNNDGIWNEDGVKLPVIIHPPFWMTVWFRLAVIILIAVIIYIIYKIRVSSIQTRARELQRMNLAMQQEIEERCKAEQEREEALQLARQSEKVKTIFLSNISHEIRTPLNSISGYSELLNKKLMSKLDDDDKEYFKLIQAGSLRLTDTVQAILDISQMETGEYNLSPENVDLVDLIRRLLFNLDDQAEAKNIKLIFESTLKSALVYIDRYCISQALMNIIQNGIKYTGEGQVTVELSLVGEHYRITITDTGIGISEDYLKELFKPFSQESTGLRKKYQGMGLGLSLARKFIELCQGEIDVQSTKKKGSVFTITLKAELHAEIDVPQETIAEYDDELGVLGVEGSYKNRKQVLVVGYDEISLNLVGHYIKEKFKIKMAGSIISAKKSLLSNLVDILIIDISSDHDRANLELIEYIRNSVDWPELPIIIISSQSRILDDEKDSKNSANEFLMKPVSQDVLLKVLDKFN